MHRFLLSSTAGMFSQHTGQGGLSLPGREWLLITLLKDPYLPYQEFVPPRFGVFRTVQLQFRHSRFYYFIIRWPDNKMFLVFFRTSRSIVRGQHQKSPEDFYGLVSYQLPNFCFYWLRAHLVLFNCCSLTLFNFVALFYSCSVILFCVSFFQISLFTGSLSDQRTAKDFFRLVGYQPLQTFRQASRQFQWFILLQSGEVHPSVLFFSLRSGWIPILIFRLGFLCVIPRWNMYQ